MKKSTLLTFISCLLLLMMAAIAPTSASDWATFQKDSYNTGISADRAPITDPMNCSLSWEHQFTFGGWSGIDEAPLVTGDMVYAVGADSHIYAFNKTTGTLTWNKATSGGGFLLGNAAIGNGIAFVPTSNGKVFAFDAETGVARWNKTVSNKQLNTPITYANGKIYFGEAMGGRKYYCLDAETGNEVWNRTATSQKGGQGSYYWAGAAVIGNSLVYGDDDGYLVSVNKSTGADIAEINISEEFGVTCGEIRSSILYVEELNRLYFTSKGGYCYALGFNPAAGTFNTSDKYRANIGQSTSTPAYYNGRVYVGAGGVSGGGNGISCLDADLTEEIWHYVAGAVQSSPVISTYYDDGDGEAYIYFTVNGNPGGIFCLKDFPGCTSPELAWSYGNADKTAFSLAGPAISDGWVYFGTDKKYLFGLTDEEEQQAPSAPVAAFTADLTSGKAPLKVQFTDQSAGEGITARAWDFDSDGIVDSSEQNPSYTYNNAGSYTVTLNLTGAGGSDIEEKAAYITVNPGPINVKIRIEGNNYTIVPLTELSLEQYDMTSYIGDSPEFPTPIYAICKALEMNGKDCKDSDAGFASAGGSYITKIDGLKTYSTSYDDGWMFYVNKGWANEGVNAFDIKNGDIIDVFFTENWQDCTYSWFEEGEEIRAAVGEDISLLLNGSSYDMVADKTTFTPMEGATILVNDTPCMVEGTEVLTDAEGKTTLNFDAPGTYIISATRCVSATDPDNKYGHDYIDMNRPYCKVIVSEPASHPGTFYDINLEASTFLGGSSYDDSYSSARDPEGNIYIALRSQSPDLTTTEGAYSSYNDNYDIYIAKFNPDLTELLAATFIGGSDCEYEPSIAVDASGNVYIAARTKSTDFPITEGAYQNISAGGNSDIVIAKLDSDLKTLLASSYLGGNGYDYQSALKIDASGSIWVAGKTKSSDFPVTERAFDKSSDSSGKYDAYLAKLDPDLTTLLASTYVGGDSGDDIIEGTGGNPISFDKNGNVFLTGHTRSESFPTTEGACKTNFTGVRDAFVTKFNPGLTELLASTYIAGSNDDYGIALVHSGNNVYLGGRTKSSDFPTSEGAYQPEILKENNYDLFLAIFDENLAELSTCTYFGGAENTDYLYSMALDEAGDIYISGMTNSKAFPVTEGAFRKTFANGADGFVSKIDGGLSKLLGSTFLGGSGYDLPYDLVVDGNEVYVAGYTDSADFPTSRGAYQSEHNGSKDACLSRLSFKLCNIIEVNENDDLQAAINSAAEGDKLLIHAGTYNGKILAVNKSLKLIGDGADKVTLDYESVLIGKELLPDGNTNTVSAPDTVLEGLGIVNPSNTLVITASSPGCTVRACSFEGMGINSGKSILVESEYNLLESNTINDSEMAHITGKANIFTANTVSNPVNEHCSLKIEGSNCQINGNTFKDSTGAGLCLAFGASGNEVLENIFQANGIGLEMYGAGENNRIALNNFIENEVNVADSGIAGGEAATVNTSWQTPETVSYFFKAVNRNGVLGNYYDDCTGNDSDNNGVLDSALVHPESLGSEEYALAGPWENGEIVVDFVLPEANFTANVSAGKAPLTVQFTDLSENATAWKWDVDGDGEVDYTEKNPVHTYFLGGNFKVTLTVQNQDGSDTESRKNYISAFGPYASAAENQNPGAPDAGIPGFVGPDGDGKAGGNNYVNPVFVEWASGCVNYSPAAGVSSTWQSFSKALGPVKGNNFDIVSLGDLNADQIAAGTKPGEITLSFDAPICNGEGPDLAAFENGFISSGGAGVSGQLAAELAYMEVSTDGVNFVRFPSVSLTPAPVGGYGSIDPTNIYNLVGKHCNAYSACWGTPFDLEDLKNETEVTSGLVDLNEINYVKLVDIPGSGNFTDSLGNPIYDAWVTWGSGGLDLEAVGVINAAVAPTNPTLSFEPSDLLVVDGRSGEIRLIADSFPNGLSGYNLSVKIEAPEIAEITGIEYPAWANPTENSSLPGPSVYLKATDAPLEEEDVTGTVKPGDSNVVLANITVLGKATGTTNISITVTRMDDDSGNEIECIIHSESLSVGTEAFPDPLCKGSPQDLNGDGIFEDITGNGECTFTDLQLYFHYMEWIEENRPVGEFDFNGNDRIDFNDVVLMFREIQPLE